MAPRTFRRAICNDPAPKGINPELRIYRSSPFEICYLSWGSRRYGRSPLPPVLSEGWHYFIVLSGTPVLLIGDQELRMRPGMVSVAHPDCPIGHRDVRDRSCQILTWIWRTPPAHPRITAEPSAPLLLQLEPAQLPRFKTLHQQCREAVANSTDRGMLQLKIARLQLDLWLADANENRGISTSARRLEEAFEFLRTHLSDPHVVKRLRDYLQISDASLKRLFHRHTGKSPGACARERRMKTAMEELIPLAESVKAVAYAVGYKHPADFSRAFKRQFGISAITALNRHRAKKMKRSVLNRGAGLSQPEYSHPNQQGREHKDAEGLFIGV